MYLIQYYSLLILFLNLCDCNVKQLATCNLHGNNVGVDIFISYEPIGLTADFLFFIEIFTVFTFFGGLECVGRSFAYVAHFVFFERSLD
jgi:hypothetical protein